MKSTNQDKFLLNNGELPYITTECFQYIMQNGGLNKKDYAKNVLKITPQSLINRLKRGYLLPYETQELIDFFKSEGKISVLITCLRNYEREKEGSLNETDK